MTRKHALKTKPKNFRKSAFVEDAESVFHPLISVAAVFRRCERDRIFKLGEETRDSANMLTGQQMIRNSEFGVGFSRMGIGIPPMYPLASGLAATRLETLATGVGPLRHLGER